MDEQVQRQMNWKSVEVVSGKNFIGGILDVFKDSSMERKEMAIVLLMQMGRTKNTPIRNCDNLFLDMKPGHIVIKLENR